MHFASFFKQLPLTRASSVLTYYIKSLGINDHMIALLEELTTLCLQHKIFEVFLPVQLSICVFERIFLARTLTQLQLEQTEI